MSAFLINPTTLSAIVFRQKDKHDASFTCCVAKRSYKFDVLHSGETEFVEIPSELILADEYSKSHPGLLELASDLVPTKPYADIYFRNPTAHSGSLRASTAWEVSVEVGSLKTSFFVTGPRQATKTLLGWNVSEMKPVKSVDIGYRAAYGGRIKEDDEYACNPIGRGYALQRGASVGSQCALPHVGVDSGTVARPLNNRTEIGLGPIPPSWAQRRRFAGTYDGGWRNHRAPRLPVDFDNRFFCCAPENLQYAGYLSGNECVRLRGLDPEGELEFRLPVDYSVGLMLKSEHKDEYLSMLSLDTLVFDLDSKRLDFVWRTCFPRGGHAREAALAIFPWEGESYASA